MKMRWEGRVSCDLRVGEENCTKRFGGKPEGNSHLEDLRVDGTLILKWM